MVSQCFCGCGQRAVQRHHAVYEAELRRLYRTWKKAGDTRGWTLTRLTRDPRVLLPVARSCHDEHHARIRPLPAACLPDGVFEFAREIMTPGQAYEFISRRYSGDDPRLDELLAEHEREMAA